MKFGVLVFPGSNCDHDTHHVLSGVMGQPVTYLWHESHDLEGCDAILIPGGFAYGDYLRTGAIARFAPIMQSVRRFADSGGLVMGICNGFQILCEAQLLPGALVRNRDLHFRCEHVKVRVENFTTPWTNTAITGSVLNLPIAHGEGSYVADAATLRDLNRGRQVLLRYCDANGATTDAANPNGSVENIAGICNAARNIFGLMPHPERACDARLGSTDGRVIFESILIELGARKAA